MADRAERPPLLLRVHFPRRLDGFAGASEVHLAGRRLDGNPPELVVTSGGSSGGAEPAVATLLLSGDAPSARSAALPAFVLRPTTKPGGQLPILVASGSLAAPAATAAGVSTRRRSAQQQTQQLRIADWQCQVLLYGGRTSQLVADGSSGSGVAPCGPGGRARLAAHLAARLLRLLLAGVLLAHVRGITEAAAKGSSSLADAAAHQLRWLMTAQPAGVKLHRQMSELLGVAGLQYLAAARWVLAGRGPAAVAAATGALAVVLAGWGSRRSLQALQPLLWALALPVSLPYAAAAALYRWQLRSTALMWRVMRGIQPMPPLRAHVAHAVLRRAGATAAPSDAPPSAPGSPKAGVSDGGSSLRQLSGSMLLFMPLLLLLPTTAAFYAFALALHAACSLPRGTAALGAALLAHNPAAAAAVQLLWPAGGSGSVAVECELLHVQFKQGALSAAELQAAQRTTYLAARHRGGSPWRAATRATATAWAACDFPAAWQLAWDVLAGNPLWLAIPRDWRGM